MKMHKHLIRKS